MTVSATTLAAAGPSLNSKASASPSQADGPENGTFAALLSAQRASKSSAGDADRTRTVEPHGHRAGKEQEIDDRDDETAFDDKSGLPSDLPTQTLDIASQAAAQVERSRALAAHSEAGNSAPDDAPPTAMSEQGSRGGPGAAMQAGVARGRSVGIVADGSIAMRTNTATDARARATDDVLPNQGTPSLNGQNLRNADNAHNPHNAANVRTGPSASTALPRAASEGSAGAGSATSAGLDTSTTSSSAGAGPIASHPIPPAHGDPSQPAAGAANLALPAQGAGTSSLQPSNQPGAFTPLHIAAPVGHDQWGQALARQMITLSHGGPGSHVAQLQLNPPELGPLRIQIHITDGVAQASFMSAHGAVRQALEAAMPQLQHAMHQSGVSLERTDVGDHMPNPFAGNENHEQPKGKPGAMLADGAAEIEIDVPAVSGGLPRNANRLLDTFA